MELNKFKIPINLMLSVRKLSAVALLLIATNNQVKADHGTFSTCFSCGQPDNLHSLGHNSGDVTMCNWGG